MYVMYGVALTCLFGFRLSAPPGPRVGGTEAGSGTHWNWPLALRTGTAHWAISICHFALAERVTRVGLTVTYGVYTHTALTQSPLRTSSTVHSSQYYVVDSTKVVQLYSCRQYDLSTAVPARHFPWTLPASFARRLGAGHGALTALPLAGRR